MKVEMDHFSGQEIERVYLASTLEEAKRVEKILDTSPFVYAIDLEPFTRPIASVFGGTYAGVGFYVAPTAVDVCKRFLTENGITAGIEIVKDE